MISFAKTMRILTQCHTRLKHFQSNPLSFSIKNFSRNCMASTQVRQSQTSQSSSEPALSDQSPIDKNIVNLLREKYGSTLPVITFKDAVSEHFPNMNPEECITLLKDKIYESNISIFKSVIQLQSPQELEEKLHDEFTSIKTVQDAKIQQLIVSLIQVKEELHRLQKTKEHLDLKAVNRVRLMIYTSCLYLTAQMSLYAKFTWYDFGWDIMEPITYFTTFSTITLSYLYFLILNREYTYEHASQLLLAKQRGKLYYKNKFDIHLYEQLIEKAQQIQTEIELESIRINGYIKEEYKELFYTRPKPASL